MNLSEHEATIAADILTPDQVNSAIVVCRLTAHCGRALEHSHSLRYGRQAHAGRRQKRKRPRERLAFAARRSPTG